MKRILFLLLILASVNIVVAANERVTAYLDIPAFSVTPGGEKIVYVNLNNPDKEYVSVQFDLYLPDGCSVTELSRVTSRMQYIEEDGERIYSTSLKSSKRPDGATRVIMIPNTAVGNLPFTGTYGSIIKLVLKTSSTIKEGTYNISMRNVSLTDVKAQTDYIDDRSAQFSVYQNYYRLTYLIDGALFKNTNVCAGSAIKNPAVVSKDGYTFSGWDREIASMPQHNDTIRGSYIPNKYTVTFLDYDGSVVSQASQDYGSTILQPQTAPSRTGYTFSSWILKPSDQQTPSETLKEGALVPSHDVAYVASYDINQYTLRFLDSDGTLLASLKQDYNSAVTKPDDPVKKGHSFTGWDRAVPALVPAKDMDFTASYSVNMYNVTFIVDGYSFGATPMEYGSEISFPQISRTGYTFSGWDKSDKTVPDHDITFTGSFLSNPNTLTFKVDGQTFYTLNVSTGDSIPQIQAPEKEGYTFSAWSGLPKTMPPFNLAVDAQYNINSYTVSFLDYDGTVLSSYKKNYKSTVTKPANPDRQGYTFSGWDKDIPATMPAGDMTFTAQYKVNSHTLSLYNADNTLFKTYTVDYGTPLLDAIKELPTKVGYDFASWNHELPASMPDSDLSLTASFVRSVYDIDGVSYTPDLNAAETALTGYATVTGVSSSAQSSAKKIMILRAKYAETQTEAKSILIPSTITPNPSSLNPNPSTLNSLTVATIAKAAFSGSNITSITIPETVTKIEESAVSDCGNLQSVVFLGDTSPEMEAGAIEVSDDVEVYVPSTADESFSEALQEQSGTDVEVTKADVVSNYYITVYQSGSATPQSVEGYAFGDNVVLTAPEKKYYDVVWTDRTSNLVSYTNPYVFSAVKDVDVEWSYKAQPYTVGDVNSDGSVNIVDVTLLVSYLRGVTPSPFHELAADANNDGAIDKSDVDAIVSIIKSMK